MRTPVFGQFLLEMAKVDNATLNRALTIQNKERSLRLKTSSRFLGQILLEESDVFENRVELEQWLKKFNKYKEHIEGIHGDLNIISKRK